MKREILTLTYSVGLSSEEIAYKLNCSVKYVYNHRRYALHVLRRLLEGDIDNDE